MSVIRVIHGELCFSRDTPLCDRIVGSETSEVPLSTHVVTKSKTFKVVISFDKSGQGVYRDTCVRYG